jgi:hypothetical protein
MPDQYFATLPTEQLTPMLMDKFDNYSQYISATGRLTIWRRVYYNFYKADYDQGRVTAGRD